MSDLTQPGSNLIIDLVNSTNDDTLNNGLLGYSDVTFGTPSINPTTSVRNTTVYMTAASGLGTYGGSRAVIYNRLNFWDDIFAVIETSGTMRVPADQISDYATSDQVVAYLNSKYGAQVKIDSVDYVSENTGITDLPAKYLLRAGAGSLKYIGTLTLNILDGRIEMSAAMKTTSIGTISVIAPAS